MKNTGSFLYKENHAFDAWLYCYVLIQDSIMCSCSGLFCVISLSQSALRSGAAFSLHLNYIFINPDIMQPPAAPAFSTSPIFAGDIPPIAYTGKPLLSRQAAFRKSRPFLGSPFLQSVSKMLPRTICVAPSFAAFRTSSILWHDTLILMKCAKKLSISYKSELSFSCFSVLQQKSAKDK